jgi:hypothetical protein
MIDSYARSKGSQVEFAGLGLNYWTAAIFMGFYLTRCVFVIARG